jgi:hypothetical protein
VFQRLHVSAFTAFVLGLTFFFGFALATDVAAVPVQGAYFEDPRCDPVPDQPLPHEIGETAVFPVDELIDVLVFTGTPICVPDDGAPNDFLVSITNLSPFPYVNLFFVADEDVFVGNSDGVVADLAGAPGIVADAFRIDGTVTVTGLNDNLLFESLAINEIFEPGETWEFLVTNFVVPAGGVPTPVFDSPGLFAGSSVGVPLSNASILATQIPEPSTALLLGIGLSGLAFLRRRAC